MTAPLRTSRAGRTSRPRRAPVSRRWPAPGRAGTPARTRRRAGDAPTSVKVQRESTVSSTSSTGPGGTEPFTANASATLRDCWAVLAISACGRLLRTFVTASWNGSRSPSATRAANDATSSGSRVDGTQVTHAGRGWGAQSRTSRTTASTSSSEKRPAARWSRTSPPHPPSPQYARARPGSSCASSGIFLLWASRLRGSIDSGSRRRNSWASTTRARSSSTLRGVPGAPGTSAARGCRRVVEGAAEQLHEARVAGEVVVHHPLLGAALLGDVLDPLGGVLPGLGGAPVLRTVLVDRALDLEHLEHRGEAAATDVHRVLDLADADPVVARRRGARRPRPRGRAAGTRSG